MSQLVTLHPFMIEEYPAIAKIMQSDFSFAQLSSSRRETDDLNHSDKEGEDNVFPDQLDS